MPDFTNDERDDPELPAGWRRIDVLVTDTLPGDDHGLKPGDVVRARPPYRMDGQVIADAWTGLDLMVFEIVGRDALLVRAEPDALRATEWEVAIHVDRLVRVREGNAVIAFIAIWCAYADRVFVPSGRHWSPMKMRMEARRNIREGQRLLTMNGFMISDSLLSYVTGINIHKLARMKIPNCIVSRLPREQPGTFREYLVCDELRAWVAKHSKTPPKNAVDQVFDTVQELTIPTKRRKK